MHGVATSMISIFFCSKKNTYHRTKGYTEEEKILSKKIMRYWANFARTGDPNRHPEGPITDDWPVYTPNGKEYFTLDVGQRKVIGRGQSKAKVGVRRSKADLFWCV